MATWAACQRVEQGAGADEELVEEVRAGWPARFEVLVRRHEPRLRRAVRSMLRDGSEVDDVVQQTFADAFAGLGGFAGTAAFATWLLRIALNQALMRARRARRVERTAAALRWLPAAEEADPERAAGWREALAQVRAAVERLPAAQREVLRLAVEDGLSSAEIAGRLGIRDGAAKLRLHRARKALRLELGGGRRPRSGTPPLPVAAGGPGLIGFPRREALQSG